MPKIIANRYNATRPTGDTTQRTMAKQNSGKWVYWTALQDANRQIEQLEAELQALKDAWETRDLLEVAVMKRMEELINEKLGI